MSNDGRKKGRRRQKNEDRGRPASLEVLLKDTFLIKVDNRLKSPLPQKKDGQMRDKGGKRLSTGGEPGLKRV